MKDVNGTMDFGFGLDDEQQKQTIEPAGRQELLAREGEEYLEAQIVEMDAKSMKLIYQPYRGAVDTFLFQATAHLRAQLLAAKTLLGDIRVCLENKRLDRLEFQTNDEEIICRISDLVSAAKRAAATYDGFQSVINGSQAITTVNAAEPGMCKLLMRLDAMRSNCSINEKMILVVQHHEETQTSERIARAYFGRALLRGTDDLEKNPVKAIEQFKKVPAAFIPASTWDRVLDNF